ncbi:3-isopropylmalate dehydratase small subunit [Tessaracoccus flavus]|uniref:3-isopropylmalate dehydratase small subunit n=1 Tax=Tessaracoccus flavus TaxID=1610493 RepID=A0A1Q2CF55_9ACTN|nr:3-isopropylmalate dehydratase small subunit [Tessaracoccus flavus]AQP44738.1 3-isopropylmalate dehydratase small subunit [Tessaracoccus flavus]SDZ16395.1 3-isopropylmalate dehydratase, small subunit [Tessaracoccus flavus]
MEPFVRHTGIAVPLERSNVDTDQIIPAVYLKRITRTGFEDGLFAAWRNDPEFVLNREPFTQGTILIPGPDFGTGSSREHAVWALQNYGFKAVIGTRFGDIFRSNSGKAGLLVALVSEADRDLLWQAIEADPNVETTVDLESQTITRGDLQVSFDIDDYTKHRLLNGLDDISLTLQQDEAISTYEASRPSFKPKTLPAKTAG